MVSKRGKKTKISHLYISRIGYNPLILVGNYSSTIHRFFGDVGLGYALDATDATPKK